MHGHALSAAGRGTREGTRSAHLAMPVRTPSCVPDRSPVRLSCALHCGAQPGAPGGTAATLRSAVSRPLRGLREGSRCAQASTSQSEQSPHSTAAPRTCRPGAHGYADSSQFTTRVLRGPRRRPMVALRQNPPFTTRPELDAAATPSVPGADSADAFSRHPHISAIVPYLLPKPLCTRWAGLC
jgi:hypothetical protein